MEAVEFCGRADKRSTNRSRSLVLKMICDLENVWMDTFQQAGRWSGKVFFSRFELGSTIRIFVICFFYDDKENIFVGDLLWQLCMLWCTY